MNEKVGDIIEGADASIISNNNEINSDGMRLSKSNNNNNIIPSTITTITTASNNNTADIQKHYDVTIHTLRQDIKLLQLLIICVIIILLYICYINMLLYTKITLLEEKSFRM